MAMADLALFKDKGPISLTEISIRQNISLAYLEKLFVPKYYPGFILSIYENGNESYFLKKGYDDIFKKTEYKRDSIFRIYSMTKPIVSTAAMQLIEKKQLWMQKA